MGEGYFFYFLYLTYWLSIRFKYILLMWQEAANGLLRTHEEIVMLKIAITIIEACALIGLAYSHAYAWMPLVFVVGGCMTLIYVFLLSPYKEAMQSIAQMRVQMIVNEYFSTQQKRTWLRVITIKIYLAIGAIIGAFALGIIALVPDSVSRMLRGI